MIMTTTASAPSNKDRAIVEAFYTRLINPAGAQDKMAEAERILAPNFGSIGDYSGYVKTREELAKQLGGFAQLMPDLNWQIEDIIEAGNRFIVRSRVTGTPKGPLFGVDGQGKSFTVMSIDVHEVDGGQIVKVFHVEDWAAALRQLSGK
ncbi:MAG: polyketide cyclase [Rhizobiales bacterium PAR1]|nr:MAG: polyketide cyclase [Rhizobiales bacterium PAR1]